MKYELIGGQSPAILNQLVEDMLAVGWRLYGNPYSIHVGYAGWVHYQAMTKDYV